jgi:hypothetical protein
MATPKLVQDILIPVAYGGVEIGMDYWDAQRRAASATATPYAPYTGLVAAVLGLALMMANKYTDEAKVVVHAALPSATKQVYGWVKTAITPATTSRYAAPVARAPQSVARYPAPAYAGGNFDNLRLE